jgi:hypothetical protein
VSIVRSATARGRSRSHLRGPLPRLFISACHREPLANVFGARPLVVSLDNSVKNHQLDPICRHPPTRRSPSIVRRASECARAGARRPEIAPPVGSGGFGQTRCGRKNGGTCGISIRRDRPLFLGSSTEKKVYRTGTESPSTRRRLAAEEFSQVAPGLVRGRPAADLCLSHAFAIAVLPARGRTESNFGPFVTFIWSSYRGVRRGMPHN